MQEALVEGAPDAPNSAFEQVLKRPLDPEERMTLVGEGPFHTIKGHTKVYLHSIGDFSWDHTYLSGHLLCSVPINRLISFKRSTKGQTTGQTGTSSATFFFKILVIANSVQFVVYDECGEYLSHGDSASSVLTRAIRQAGGSGNVNGQAMLLLVATKNNLRMNFVKRHSDTMVLPLVDTHATHLTSSIETVSELGTQEPPSSHYGESAIAHQDMHSDCSETELGGQLSEDEEDGGFSASETTFGHAAALKQLQEAFLTLPKSKLVEALSEVHQEERKRKWTTAIRVSVLSEIQTFSPNLDKIPTIVDKHEELYSHLMRFLKNEHGMYDVSTQAIKCMLLELIRTNKSDDLSTLLNVEVNILLNRARPVLVKDEESIIRVENILKSCTVKERAELLRRFHAQCAFTRGNVKKDSDPQSGRFLTYLRLDDLYSEAIDKGSDGVSHDDIKERNDNAKQYLLASSMKMIVENLLQLGEQSSYDDVNKPWFWILRSSLFHMKTGQSPQFLTDELDFWSTVYNLYGISCISLLRGPNCHNICTPSPSRLRKHNAEEAEMACSRTVGPIKHVIQEAVEETFSDPEQTLGIKMDETDLTKESGPDGDVNYSVEVRNTTDRFKTANSAIQQDRWQKEDLLEWIERNKKDLTAKKAEVIGQLDKKKSQVRNAATSAAKLKASVSELETRVQEVDDLLKDIENIHRSIIADPMFAKTVLSKQKDSVLEELVRRSYSLLRRPATKLLAFMISDSKRRFSRECAFYLIDDSFSVTVDGRRLYEEVASAVQTCIAEEGAKANGTPPLRPLMLWRSFDGHWQSLSLLTSSGDPKTEYQHFRQTFHEQMEALKGVKPEEVRKRGERDFRNMDFCEEDVKILLKRFGKKVEIVHDHVSAVENEIVGENGQADEDASQDGESVDPVQHRNKGVNTAQKKRKVEKKVEDTEEYMSAKDANEKVIAIWRFTTQAKQMLAVLTARAAMKGANWTDFVKVEICSTTGEPVFDFEDAGHLLKRVRSMIVKAVSDGRVFLGQFRASAWVEVAKQEPKVLTQKHLQGVDIQSVPYAVDFFTVEVEKVMRRLALPEADLYAWYANFGRRWIPVE